jgi:RsiW-degrading membrane proteinase PrsW (M82 family)
MIGVNMKLILTITSGTLSGQKYDLTTGHLLVGRSEHCSIRFDPLTEKIASKQHAFIEARPDGFYVTDNNSTNGTLVNGQQIQSAKLNPGDAIQFGKNGVVAKVEIDSNNISPPAVGKQNQPTIAQDLFDQMQMEQISQTYDKQNISVRNTISGIGLGSAVAEPPQTPVGKYVVLGIMIFLIVILLIPVLLIMGLSLGPGVAIVATIVAFLPATIYLIPLAWLDRYDPEPLWLLATAFAWGAVVAVFASFVINTLFGTIAAVATQSLALGNILGAVISAPIFEELTKGLGLVLLLIFFRRDFDDILDGIVFGGVVALGFATVENVLYYGRGILQGGALGLAFLFFLRGILSPFAHVTFTAMTGIGCGISRESHNTAVKFLMPIVGYIGAVVLHMIWNGMAVVAILVIRLTGLNVACDAIGMGGPLEGICAFMIGYILLEVPFFFIFIIFSIWMMRRQNRILNEMLAIDVARGLIPQEHLDTVTSGVGSLFWSLSGLTSGKYFARRRYMRAIGKLGLSYWHIQRATAAQGETGSFQQNPILRQEVLKWKDQV